MLNKNVRQYFRNNISSGTHKKFIHRVHFQKRFQQHHRCPCLSYFARIFHQEVEPHGHLKLQNFAQSIKSADVFLFCRRNEIVNRSVLSRLGDLPSGTGPTGSSPLPILSLLPSGKFYCAIRVLTLVRTLVGLHSTGKSSGLDPLFSALVITIFDRG